MFGINLPSLIFQNFEKSPKSNHPLKHAIDGTLILQTNGMWKCVFIYLLFTKFGNQ